MELTVPQYANHFDMALHLQSATEDDIRKHAQTARDTGVAACYTNSFWTPVVRDVLKGSDVRVGTAISFPYGCTSTAMKFAEIEEGLELGATAVDMVVNIGAVHDGNYSLVEKELVGLVDRCKDKAITKLIFEVGFLTDEQIADLTKLCCEVGIDYVKTATGSEAFPSEHQIRVMKENLSGDKTKLKVSGVPRTFTMPATLWMIEKLGVSLIGTRSAARLVKEYEEYLKRGY
ncbi:deoxyribose-phosphate aldolase [Trueperella abortisuis]|uniref:deoxyribose-phosphate aldolase n=1 Tax=Trueperella abortisuis TaxID=445930 RepID=UPI0028932D5A|nr:deoxyribose-phosphate aldolase [Trueperella abortisuis]